MKRKVYRAKDDHDINMDADNYVPETSTPAEPKPMRYGLPFGSGKIKPGVYMQPNGQPVMIMPMIAGMPATTVQQAKNQNGQKKN